MPFVDFTLAHLTTLGTCVALILGYTIDLEQAGSAGVKVRLWDFRFYAAVALVVVSAVAANLRAA